MPNNLLAQIDELLSKATKDDTNSETIAQIKVKLEERAQQLIEDERKEALSKAISLFGFSNTDVTTWEDYAIAYLRTQGYKKFSKRASSRKVTTASNPITPEVVEKAKKLVNGDQKKVSEVARGLKVNTNSLKKVLGFNRTGTNSTKQATAKV